jgi:hypothetical protein
VTSGDSDPRTGRPLKPVTELSDEELELELTVAAAAPDHQRTDRYQELLRERARRADGRGDGPA